MQIERGAVRVLLSMTAQTHGPADDYRRLRLAYDIAFRDFTEHVRLFQTVIHGQDPGHDRIQQAQERLATAEAAYRRTRDLLAAHVLTHGATARA